MNERLFGTDGVRGEANVELTPELALRLGLAAGHLFSQQSSHPKVVVGVDSRVSGPMLESALASGLCAMGIEVICPGLMPTPAVAKVTQAINASAGVVISASHNPYQDNGIKFFGSSGHKLDDDLERALEELVPNAMSLQRALGSEIGHIYRDPTLLGIYSKYVEATMNATRLDGYKIVIDAANGAASHIGPRIFRELGADVIELNCSPNGININQNCGALHPIGMADKVRELGADAGIAFDGDADRAILADSSGQIVDGDRVMAICGIALAKKGHLNGMTVVGTIMSNMGLEIALRKHAITLERTAVGDRNVSERMREGGFVIGGEKSGHIIFGDLSTTGDGILTALQVLKVVRESNRSLAELASIMSDFPQTLVNIPVTDRVAWEQDQEVLGAIQGAEHRLRGEGRINVRASGTEKLIRVMVEAPTQGQVDAIAESVATVVRANWGV